jgi:signal transduction histidine kinase
VDAMTTTALPSGAARGVPTRRRRPMPWSPSSWRQALYLAGAIPAMLIGMSVPLVRLLIAGRWSVIWHGIAGPVIWVPWIGMIFLLLPLLTQVQRHRLRTTAGIDIPSHPPAQDRLTVQGLVAAARSQATWRQVGYHLIAAPALAAAAAVAIGAWLAALLCALEYLWGWMLPPWAWFRQATYPTGGMNVPHPGGPSGVWLTLVGIVGLFVASWLTAGVASLDARAARALLGPSRAEELEHRVERLTQTRAGVVDAADAERRRLERDLHDGTQQRLVALAINLGMARVNATTTGEARQALAEAHEEAKAALSELRDLIRGLHPAVLEDRGLDAALSGVAARMPIPVRLSVDLPRRPAPVIEAVAYFVVSEGLANIAKHAQASQAEVVVQRIGDRLHIIVSDDGIGGADPARGTGLTGLARRAESVDGAFDVFSPPGGPTLLSVDLPCSR